MSATVVRTVKKAKLAETKQTKEKKRLSSTLPQVRISSKYKGKRCGLLISGKNLLCWLGQ
jgi:hypothetical protein